MQALERTSRLLHRIVPEYTQWQKVLLNARQRLQPSYSQPVKLAIISDDPRTTKDLVTATFADPFSDLDTLRTDKFGVPIEITDASEQLTADIRVLVSSIASSTPIAPNTMSLYITKKLYIDPQKALSAINTLRANPSSPSSIQTYQNEFSASGVSHFIDSLKLMLAAPESIGKRTAFLQLHAALEACRSSLLQLKQGIHKLEEASSNLKEKTEQARARVVLEVFGHDLGESKNENAVDIALKRAREESKKAMDSLTIWKLINPIWRVDDISVFVGNVVDSTWCNDLEQRLIFHTGRLSTLQKRLSDSAFDLVSNAESPLLQNTLSQLSSRPSYLLTPSSLTSPIRARRAQINQFPTVRLHLEGNKAVRRIFGSVSGGLGLSWLGWTGLLTQFVPAWMALDGGTTVGLGALGALVGIRWAVERWEKGKQRWWEDWDRVGQGLRRDLMDVLEGRMNQNVLIIPETAISGASGLVAKKKEEFAEIEEELKAVEQELVSEKVQS